MDSFFKAAVCDLDKLLDDFELNTEELDCKPVALTPTAYPVSSLGSQGSESSTGTHSLPDLNSLHYGTAPSCPDRPPTYSQSPPESDLKGQPLTGVDLLSSVGRGTAKSSAPPCPDRALKPVCDLVNDTSSAILARANNSNHAAFSELDVIDRAKLEEGELLVDFNSPLVTLSREESGGVSQGAGYRNTGREDALVGDVGLLGRDSNRAESQCSSSLSLLDVILPAAVERTADGEEEDAEVAHINQLVDSSPSDLNARPGAMPPSNPIEDIQSSEKTCDVGEEEKKCLESTDTNETQVPDGPNTLSPSAEKECSGLSCLPRAVSMCGALVRQKTKEESTGVDDEEEVASARLSEADCLSTVETKQDLSLPAENVHVEDCTSAEEDSCTPSLPEKVESSATLPVCTDTLEPSVCQQSLEVLVSPGEQQPSFLSPGAGSVHARSPPHSEPSPTETPEFDFEYLPESDQAGLLVTDEELDAFLRSQAGDLEELSRCSRVGEFAQDEGFSELNGDLEDRLVEEELRSYGRSKGDGGEGQATPSGEEMVNPATSKPSLVIPGTCQSELLTGVHPCESPDRSLPSGILSLQPCYGGARPKQLHCQAARSPPPTNEGEQQDQMPRDPSEGPSVEEKAEPNSPPSPPSPNPAEEPSHSCEPMAAYSPQERYETTVEYDELSEPPPYPGEPLPEGAGPVDDSGVEVEGVGSRQPSWVPDSEAPNCMNCWQKFTFTRRRHHCRACGKVYCAVCCNKKCRLKYLEKEARVCVICYETIQKVQALERMMSPTGPSPNPNVPSEYCSTIPPLQQARAAGTLNSPPPTVMVPVSVLKQPSNDGCPREQKRVWFADGILPNGEVADTTKLSVSGRRSSQETSPVTPDPPMSDDALGPGGSEGRAGSGASEPEVPEMVRPPLSGPWDYGLLCGVGACVQRSSSLLPEDDEGLPPLLITTGEDDQGGDILVEERPAPCQILLLLEEGGPRPLTFVLNANLLVNVKLVTYCGRRCWCFGSSGLQALGQRELVFVLECLPEERALPKDLFNLYLNIYQDAQRGKFVEQLCNVTFTASFLGSKEHGGMLFFSPSCQPLEGLSLPPQPFLCGLLIQRLEVPWAKVFPLRLLLRLGAEHSVYPSSLVSVRFRGSVYRETGHTIMNLLADLRNFQYSLPAVEGLRIHMEMGHSYIDIPKSSFSEMLKVVNSSNEHVISVGASLSAEADSHLVCFQNEEGNYQTQASSMADKTRTVTGASFVVFNGALKASSGFIAKSSIVEDGLMVQIPPDTMELLRTALREQTDFHIPCGKADGAELRDNVTVRWVDWTALVNTGVTSGVDGRPLDGVYSVRVQQDTEFESDGRTIRCTEVFYRLKSTDSSLVAVLPSCSVFQREMALAACSALTPHLAVLIGSGINSLSLLVSTQTDMVEYQAGSGGRLLPQRYMNELDSALIPVIHGGRASVPQTAMDMEFTFYITHTI
ncbi:zinc finger FYVE domain-containing protein 16 [Aplochiton taeniatus]